MMTHTQKSTATFAAETLTEELWSELLPLINAHVDESECRGDGVMKPAKRLYLELAASGSLVLVTMRIDDELTGYCVAMMSPSLRYSGVTNAINDLVYVKPENRTLTAFGGLMDAMEHELAKHGVDTMTHNVMPTADISPILRYVGWKKTAEVWSKEVDHGC